MLEEPEIAAERAEADASLMAAVAARLAQGAGPADAEAVARRTLLASAPSAATARTLRMIWTRLDAEMGGSIVTSGAEADLLGADRFGPRGWSEADPEKALRAVAGSTRALIALGGRPWWGRMLLRPELSVVAAFPDDSYARPRALLVAEGRALPTGDDRTFWLTDSALPDARIVQALGEAGLAASPLASAGGLKLFTLAGYVQAEDGRLTGAPGGLTGVIGAAPVY